MSSRKPIRKEKITNPGEHLEEWKKFKEQLKEHYESNPDQKIQDKDLHYWKEHADNRIASLEDEVKKAERKQKWAAGLPYAYLVVLLFVALFLGNGNLTGFVVSEQAYDSDLGGFIGYCSICFWRNERRRGNYADCLHRSTKRHRRLHSAEAYQ